MTFSKKYELLYYIFYINIKNFTDPLIGYVCVHLNSTISPTMDVDICSDVHMNIIIVCTKKQPKCIFCTHGQGHNALETVSLICYSCCFKGPLLNYILFFLLILSYATLLNLDFSLYPLHLDFTVFPVFLGCGPVSCIVFTCSIFHTSTSESSSINYQTKLLLLKSHTRLFLLLW